MELILYTRKTVFAYSITDLENVGAFYDSAVKYTELLEKEGFIYIQKFVDNDGSTVLVYQKNNILVYYSSMMLNNTAYAVVYVKNAD